MALTDRPVTVDEWIPMARRYAKFITKNHPHHAKDVEGEILLLASRMNPETYYHFGCCCKWASSNYFRKLLGNDGRKARVADAIPYSYLLEIMSSPDGEVDESCLLTDPSPNVEQSVVDEDSASRFLAKLDDTDLRIVLAVGHGLKYHEIASKWGVTPQAISRRVGRIRRRWLSHKVNG